MDVTLGHREEVHAILEEVTALRGVVGVQEYVDLRTFKDEPAALQGDRLSANVPCFECKGPIPVESVKVCLDGHYHHFCCHTCERLYLEKCGRIKAAARKGA